jgi:integrase
MTLDEARRLYAVCLSEASPAAVAVLSMLLLGLRCGELLALSARALDDGGKILRVFRGKTRAAARPLGIPEELRPLLARIAKQSPERLWPHKRNWIRGHLERLASLASIPIHLSPHCLRGSFATLAIESGAATLQVAALLGHTGTQVGRRHYIAPGATEAAQVVRIGEVMRSASVPQES